MPTSPTMPESPRSLSAKEGCEPNSFLRVLPCADDRCFPRTSHRAIPFSMLNTALLELFPHHPSDSPPPSLRNPHVALSAITLSISLSLSTIPFSETLPHNRDHVYFVVLFKTSHSINASHPSSGSLFQHGSDIQ